MREKFAPPLGAHARNIVELRPAPLLLAPLPMGRYRESMRLIANVLQQVHGEGWAAYDRSVDVHISRIRQKIEEDPKRPTLLKTVRGVGYQLAQTESS